MILKIKRLMTDATLPTYAHSGDAGLDVTAAEQATIEPGKSRLIRTGIAIELPGGTEAQIRPRSGLALRHSITVLNSPGTIDEGFRGELGVILINHGIAPMTIPVGMKIAQLVVAMRLTVEVQEVASMTPTTRGKSGFGSTGE